MLGRDIPCLLLDLYIKLSKISRADAKKYSFMHIMHKNNSKFTMHDGFFVFTELAAFQHDDKYSIRR